MNKENSLQNIQTVIENALVHVRIADTELPQRINSFTNRYNEPVFSVICENFELSVCRMKGGKIDIALDDMKFQVVNEKVNFDDFEETLNKMIIDFYARQV